MKKNQTHFGIIGFPVSHSLSPFMHNAAFKKLEIPSRYSKFEVSPKQLKSFFKKIPSNSLKGLNVTVPHKEAVIPYLDKLSPEAKLIAAVNTIRIEKNKLHGYNTDGAGYLESLRREKKWKARGKNIVLLGAGGAARGILVALALAGAKQITIANRSSEKAKILAQEFRKKFKKVRFETCGLSPENLTLPFSKADLLVNTTSAGMKGVPFPQLPLKFIPKKALVSDIVYRPLLTPLLKEAKKHRLKTHGGLGMLLHQGALAFEIWTGRKAPIAVMKKALLRKVEGKR